MASLIVNFGAQRVLEIGCGVGYSTLALANKGIQALSIDPILEAIEETKSFNHLKSLLEFLVMELNQ